MSKSAIALDELTEPSGADMWLYLASRPAPEPSQEYAERRLAGPAPSELRIPEDIRPIF